VKKQKETGLFNPFILFKILIFLFGWSPLLDTHVDLPDHPRGDEDDQEAAEDGDGLAQAREEGVVVCYLLSISILPIYTLVKGQGTLTINCASLASSDRLSTVSVSAVRPSVSM